MSHVNEEETRSKLEALLRLLRESEKAVIAFSGGVDSSFLLKAMTMANMKIIAVTALSETVSPQDSAEASGLAQKLGVPHLIVETKELSKESFASNPPDRCFHCKDELFSALKPIARDNNIQLIFDGTNADDLQDYRPGRKAAAMHGVRSPLAETSLSKNEIRYLARELHLGFWDRPASPCLASRFPYGERITVDRLRRVGKAEESIRGLGISDLRVRSHGDTARIEVPEKDFGKFLIPENRKNIILALKALGFVHVSLDLEEFRSGNLNSALTRGS